MVSSVSDSYMGDEAIYTDYAVESVEPSVYSDMSEETSGSPAKKAEVALGMS